MSTPKEAHAPIEHADYSPQDFTPFAIALKKKGHAQVGLIEIHSGGLSTVSQPLRDALESEGITSRRFRVQKESAWLLLPYREVAGYFNEDDITYVEQARKENNYDEFRRRLEERRGPVTKIKGVEVMPILIVDGDAFSGKTVIGVVKSLLENHDVVRFSTLYVVVGRDSFEEPDGLTHYAVKRYWRRHHNGFRGNTMNLVKFLAAILPEDEFTKLLNEGKFELINGVTKRRLNTWLSSFQS